jgi:hypothetical protein
MSITVSPAAQGSDGCAGTETDPSGPRQTRASGFTTACVGRAGPAPSFDAGARPGAAGVTAAGALDAAAAGRSATTRPPATMANPAVTTTSERRRVAATAGWRSTPSLRTLGQSSGLVVEEPAETLDWDTCGAAGSPARRTHVLQPSLPAAQEQGTEALATGRG